MAVQIPLCCGMCYRCIGGGKIVDRGRDKSWNSVRFMHTIAVLPAGQDMAMFLEGIPLLPANNE